jgi:hypothetical protein
MYQNQKEEIIRFYILTTGETLYLTKNCEDVFRVWIEDDELYNGLDFESTQEVYEYYYMLDQIDRNPEEYYEDNEDDDE